MNVIAAIGRPFARGLGTPLTLSFYFGRRFLVSVAAMECGLTALVALFDFLELLREIASKPSVHFGLIVEIELLRVPSEMIQLLPFAILLGGIYAFSRLSRFSELAVTRAAGISAWQFLAVPVTLAVISGWGAIGVLSPLSAVMYARGETLYDAFIGVGGGPLSLAGGELWLRQADHGLEPRGVAVLHAVGVHLEGSTLDTAHVSILRLDAEGDLRQRIEAAGGVLDRGQWHLSGASILAPDAPPKPVGALDLPTDLTVARVQQSFASPNALSFWALPGFIKVLRRSGFPTTQHELAFQALLALPLLCATMALVAAGFSMRPARRGGAMQMAAGGVSCGFALFMVSEVAQQFGTSGAIPVVLAAWAPALAGMMLALALLLHLEDG